jgi:Putative lumazine-binding
MRPLPILTAFLVTAGSSPALWAQGAPLPGEQASVRAVVERYLHGLKFNDVKSLQSAFWADARLLFVRRDGTLGQLTQPEWYAGFTASAGKEEQGELGIAAVDITGDAASVKVVETYPKSIYVDYLNLLKTGGEWRIMNKIYTARPRDPAADAPKGARPDDVASLDAIIAALYDVISGPAGQQRDWDRFRSLFAPGARLIPTVYRPDSVPSLRVWDPQQYVSTVGPRLQSGGFFEREVARRTEQYGGVVHLFSTYESRRTAEDPAPFARGINSIQAFFDGKRWWIVTIYWEGERPGNPIPPRYLETPGR